MLCCGQITSGSEHEYCASVFVSPLLKHRLPNLSSLLQRSVRALRHQLLQINCEGLWNEDQLPRVQKETKPTFRGKWEGVSNGKHMDNVPKETHSGSVMTFQPLETIAKVRNEKGDRLLPHPIRRQNRLTARNKNPHRDQARNRKTRKTRVKIHADSNYVKIRHVDSGILPCVRITSMKKVVHTATNDISDMLRQKESPTRSRRKVVRMCISRFLSEKNLFCVKLESWDQNTPSDSPKAPCKKIKIRERKGPS